MFCNKKQCDKCGLGVDMTLTNKESGEVKQERSCIMIQMFIELQRLNQQIIGLRQDTQSRGNAVAESLGQVAKANLKRIL